MSWNVKIFIRQKGSNHPEIKKQLNSCDFPPWYFQTLCENFFTLLGEFCFKTVINVCVCMCVRVCVASHVLVLLVLLLIEACGSKSLAGQRCLHVLDLPPPQLSDGWTDEASLVQIHGSIQLRHKDSTDDKQQHKQRHHMDLKHQWLAANLCAWFTVTALHK